MNYLINRFRRLYVKLFGKKWSVINIPTLHGRGYCDSDTLLLHGMFAILVDYVEVELAWVYFIFSDEYKKNLSFYERFLASFFRIIRSERIGKLYLEWEKSIPEETCYNQASMAREIEKLYDWWKYEYPNIKDPMDESGWSDFHDEMRKKYCNNSLLDLIINRDLLSDEEKEKEHELLMKMNELEKRNYDKETEMLNRLIEIRNCLWT